MKPAVLTGTLLIMLAILLGMATAAALVAMIRALMVPTTLAAIESAFGCLVIALLLMVLCRKAWRAGVARVRGGRTAGGQHDSGLQTGK